MGILGNIFETKVKVWEGTSEEEYNANCKLLKDEKVYTQAFKVNQKTPKCNGNCATCMQVSNAKEDEELGYKKLGRGCSDDLLNAELGYDMFVIYVKKSETQKAMDILGVTELPDTDTWARPVDENAPDSASAK